MKKLSNTEVELKNKPVLRKSRDIWLLILEAYSEPNKTFTMELFCEND